MTMMPIVSCMSYLLAALSLNTLVLALPAAAAVAAADPNGQNAVKGHLELRYTYYYNDDYARYRIIGGVCAGAAMIIGITVTLLWLRRRQRKRNGVMKPAIRLNDMSAVPQGTVLSGIVINPHPVLTFSQFNYIPRSVSKGESASCNLCYKNIAKGEEVVSLHPCNHKYHEKCAFDWFTQKSTHCPECGEDMIKVMGLPEPAFYNQQRQAGNAGAATYAMPDPNHHNANLNGENYPAAPNQAHVTDKQSPFL